MSQTPLSDRRVAVPEPGLLLERDFVSDSLCLYHTLLEQVEWDDRIRARKTACFGQAYNYSGMTYDTVPMHPLLIPLVDHLEQKFGYRTNNCLLNLYADGAATMGFHSDSEEEIMPTTGVAIISLGAERNITFRSKQDTNIEYSYPLPSGSLLYMPPGIQKHWKHAILKQENAAGRISLTFRLLNTI